MFKGANLLVLQFKELHLVRFCFVNVFSFLILFGYMLNSYFVDIFYVIIAFLIKTISYLMLALLSVDDDNNLSRLIVKSLLQMI